VREHEPGELVLPAHRRHATRPRAASRAEPEPK
jgi:hypothetical protein